MDYNFNILTKKFQLLILFVFSTVGMYAQINGRVYNSVDQNPVDNVSVYINNKYKTKTDAKGFFELNDEEQSPKRLQFIHPDYAVYDELVNQKENLSIFLSPIVSLSAIEVKANKKQAFDIRRMGDVEGTRIVAGKKNEVVLVDQLVANTATNNARQVFAQVVGLNIFDYSDGGLQLGIGGRGLDPNRTANFNTRQNGYDISADVLGYPESYYSPPTEALKEIQIIRGAASLQYGTQFGGMINFVFKEPTPNKKFNFKTRNFVGSYNLYTNFTQIDGTLGKFSYSTFYNHKQGNSYRPNSGFNSNNAYVNLGYRLSEKTKISGEFTKYNYLAQQPGGLTDKQFEENSNFSNRKRNWLDVDWNLFNLTIDHEFNSKQIFSTQVFGLQAHRYTLGFRSNRISQEDYEGQVRDLIKGEFKNWGFESRFLQYVNLFDRPQALLVGLKYYNANNTAKQGPGTLGSEANFNLDYETSPDYIKQADLIYPNKNIAVFSELVLGMNDRFTLTPGMRYEWIDTEATGTFKNIITDLAGNVLVNETEIVEVEKKRDFPLFGLGASYKAKAIEFYSNISQNYRSVTFSDIHTFNPNAFISEDITDEKGYTFDLGVRGEWKKAISYDTNVFLLLYDNRIGDYTRNSDGKRGRDNIGKAQIYGLEWFTQFNLNELLNFNRQDLKWTFFVNTAFTQSEYLEVLLETSEAIKGNKVEFVPEVNVKVGMGAKWKDLSAQLQYSFVSEQFTDATNAPNSEDPINGGIIGEIPSYSILDLSLAYKYKFLSLEGGVNNMLDNNYFLRRATGYPGPGIIPSNPRNWYVGLEIRL